MLHNVPVVMNVFRSPQLASSSRRRGFTIVELLVVVVIIGILAVLVVVAYSSIQKSAAASTLKSDLKNVASTLGVVEVDAGTYPLTSTGLKYSEGTVLEYTSDGSTYCVTASSNRAQTSFYFDRGVGSVKEGKCTGHTGYVAASSAPTGWTSISVGGYNACGLRNSIMYCWGDNAKGQLGIGSTTNAPVPAAVTTSGVLSGKTITQAVAAYSDGCAVASGAVYCWGYQFHGGLGNGVYNTFTTVNSPIAVNATGVLSGKTATALSYSSYHGCVIASGAAYCWGYNNNGQVGDNTTGAAKTLPAAVSTAGVLNGKTVTDISAGGSHTCAVAGGQAYCWGVNQYGEVGNGNATQVIVPAAVSTAGVLSGKTISSIGAGSGHTCALAAGYVYCWGRNNYGQLGNGSFVDSNVPVAVSTAGVLNGKTVTALEVGYSNTCAIAGGAAYCWGYNPEGQLGNGNITNSNVPVAVSTAGVMNGKTVTAISAGGPITCALASGDIFCWGRNLFGAFGNNTTANSSVPVQVTNP